MSTGLKKINERVEKQDFSELKENDVHIWSICLLEYKNKIDYFSSILSKDECERARSFKFFKDQRQFIMARGILRCLLSNYLQQAPETIEIVYGLWGKPSLPEDKFLNFNVSHSGDYALYAVARSYKVGIDLEYINERLELEGMAPHIFSVKELANWETLDQQAKIDVFFRQWVSREAFLKASGKGWIEDEKELTTDVKNGSRYNGVNEEIKNLYYFECIPGYASALFVERGISSLCSPNPINLVFRKI